MLALINSILIHTKQKYRLKFNILVNKNEKIILEKLINNNFNIRYYIKEITADSAIINNIRVVKNYNINNVMNFARFNFSDEFPKFR